MTEGRVLYGNGDQSYENKFSIDFSNYTTIYELKSESEQLREIIKEQNHILSRIVDSIMYMQNQKINKRVNEILIYKEAC